MSKLSTAQIKNMITEWLTYDHYEKFSSFIKNLVETNSSYKEDWRLYKTLDCAEIVYKSLFNGKKWSRTSKSKLKDLPSYFFNDVDVVGEISEEFAKMPLENKSKCFMRKFKAFCHETDYFHLEVISDPKDTNVIAWRVKQNKVSNFK